MDFLGLGKLSDNGMETIKLIYPDLAQPSMKKVGYALETVLDFGNTILLPIKLMNERSKIYFQRHMESYKEKLEQVPENEIGEVPIEIGLTIMDELLKVTNKDLANLFTNLLVNASTISGSQFAHPSFITIIKNMSGDEAKIINFLNTKKEKVIYVTVNKVDYNGSAPLTDRLNNLNNLLDLDFKGNDLFYINNLCNQGILEIQSIYYKDNIPMFEQLESQYSQVMESYKEQADRLNEQQGNSDVSVKFSRGSYKVTKLGETFFRSISLEN